MTTPFPFVANTVLNASQLNAITTLPVNAKTASYTLVVGDVGQRVQMTNAAATTITVNSGIFSAGDTIWIQNMGAGTCTISAGTCTVGTASSLALAQYGGGTLVFQSASAATFFSQQSASYGVATGGTSSSITVGGLNYTLLAFTSDGTLTVTKAGLFDVLLIGGGGGGAGGDACPGGGAGGGGVLGLDSTTTIYLSANQSIDVGAAGAGSQSKPTNGAASTIGSVAWVAGGGRGGSNMNTVAGLPDSTGGNGGSGGGSSQNDLTAVAVAPFGGKAGGLGAAAAGVGGRTTAGGGGGYSAVGGNGSGTTGGAGGGGGDISPWITGATYYAGAGAGAGGTTVGGAAGNGGVAGKTSGTGNAGVNYGAGGGGTVSAAGGAGAAGVVYVRFKV